MGRPKKEAATAVEEVEKPDTMTATLKTAVKEKVAIEDMPLETLRDYLHYNEEARKLNKQLRTCRYPIKQCPVELHPKERIIFGRKDQPSNPLPVYVSNDMIDFKMTLEPGKVYDLPVCIVSYLADKGKSIWDWHTAKDGSMETYVSHKENRFNLRAAR